MNFDRQAEVRGILSDNNIPYVIKTVNLMDAQSARGHRGNQGRFGGTGSHSYEYKIYVHKKDYDKAVGLTR